MKTSSLITLIALSSAALCAHAQPKAVIQDGFSDEATAWLKKHPAVQKCADKMVSDKDRADKKAGREPMTSTYEYGDMIRICNQKSSSRKSNTPPKKMMGDVKDKDPNATPNTPQDARNKRNKKPWQDNNGYMHYPDGSASSGVVESS